jgi:hypothetical protein
MEETLGKTGKNVKRHRGRGPKRSRNSDRHIEIGRADLDIERAIEKICERDSRLEDFPETREANIGFTYGIRFVCSNRHDALLRLGEPKLVVHPGLCRIVHPGVHLWVPAGGLAIRTG